MGDPNVGELSVYDLTVAMVPPAGVAADLGHLEKKVKVKGYAKALDERAIDKLGDCLSGCDLVLVPAGMPRKPGQTRDDLFKINANIAKEVVEACARYCPNAVVALIVNPVNSVVPAMAELYKKKGLDPKKIVGVTTLDCVRANKFVAEIQGVDPDSVEVPVIGGHAGVTIMPVFSQDKHAAKIPASQIPAPDHRVCLRHVRRRARLPILHEQSDLWQEWRREGARHWRTEPVREDALGRGVCGTQG